MNLSKIIKMEQKDLLVELPKELSKNGYKNNMLATSRYIFAKGEIPIMLVAHLDTVHKTKVNTIFYDKKQDVMWSPEGIGGDDRCGVFAIMSLVEEGYKPYILFTTDEEIGCLGAEDFCNEYQFELNKEIRYIIEIDRRGNKQAIFYDCGNEDFKKYILGFDFEEEQGTWSDICQISPTFDIASVNLSAGYYREHTLQEYIKVQDLAHTINQIKLMLTDKENTTFYDYQEKERTFTTYDYSSYNKGTSAKDTKDKSKITDYDVDDTYLGKMLEDWVNLTNAEWYAKYNFVKPSTIDEVWDY